MNRIERLSAILILLQTRKLITAQEISERFEISLRTVYRDMRALDEAGVPIGAEVGKGYYLVEGYHLPPVMFTQEEAGTLMIAGKLVESFSDQSVKNYYKLALDKIKSVLPEKQLNLIEQTEKQVYVYHKGNQTSPDFENKYILKIQQALSGRFCIEVKYLSFSKKESTQRIVEPLALCFYSYQWHLIAFCRLRNDVRDFRLDRIQDMQIKSETYKSHEGFSLDNYFQELWEKQQIYRVAVRFDKKFVSAIFNSRYYYGFYEEVVKEGYVEMMFAINDYDYMAGWLISLEELVVEILEPKLNTLVKKKITNLASKYSI